MSPDTEIRSVLLAASYPPREYQHRARSHEIAAAVKALAGAVFQRDWRLVFGGHPAVSPLVLIIAREYGQKNRVLIYQSEYFFHHISPAVRALTAEGFGEIVWVQHHPDETPPGPGDAVDPTRCPRSLTVMRQEMINTEGLCGLVLIGGDTGLREELDLFRRRHRELPVIPIGTPGGIAREMIQEMRAPGMSHDLAGALAASRNYLTLSTAIVTYLSARR